VDTTNATISEEMQSPHDNDDTTRRIKATLDNYNVRGSRILLLVF
jgi:hypothetical protein